MSRPKGSKNKVKSQFGKNYPVANPQLDIVPQLKAEDDMKAEAEANAALNEQDATLDTFLIETVDKTLAAVEKDYMPVKSKSIQKQLLSLMSVIHGEIAPAINQMRQGLTTGFCREEDKYIPESNTPNYINLIGIV